jgi:Asp-tRNA(Asn)/Glu-tRNA(Gln) amidotransferase A subunit family amidase
VPTLSIPSGATPDGLPFGLQVAGRFRRDHKLMGAGRLVESLLAD